MDQSDRGVYLISTQPTVQLINILVGGVVFPL